MNWKVRLGLKLFRLWRRWWPEAYADPSWLLKSALQWDMRDWSEMPRDVTESLRCSLSVKPYAEIPPLSMPSNQLLQVSYMFRNTEYTVLFCEGITLPPYTQDSQTPGFRMFTRDVSEIDIELLQDSSFDVSQEKEIEVEEPDMMQLMFQLRGPGLLFHSDVPHVASWHQIRMWIKRFYLLQTGLKCSEEDIRVSILWSNGDMETF